ncbi:hypothetical protein Tco_0970239 [Tanacetum coccineum]
MDQSIKRSPAEDDECYGVDDLDNTINAEAQELLVNDTTDSFLLKGLEKLIDQSDLESYEYEAVNDSDSEEPIRRIKAVNTPYPVAQNTAEPNKVNREQLYSASANEIDEKKPELLDLGLIYPISDSSWVSAIHMVPKKGGIIVVLNENYELIPSRIVIGWRVILPNPDRTRRSRKDNIHLSLRDFCLLTNVDFIIQDKNAGTKNVEVMSKSLRLTLKKMSEVSVRLNSAWFKRFNHRLQVMEMKTQRSEIVSVKRLKSRNGSTFVYMAKFQEVLPAESSSTDTPLEQVQNNDEKNVFANERQHSEKHAAECADERAALANLIANLTLDTEHSLSDLNVILRLQCSISTLEYLSKLNPRALHRNKDAKSLSQTKEIYAHRKVQLTVEILKMLVLGGVTTGKLFTYWQGKVENEPTHGSNVDIHHIHACKQTLGLSVGTSLNGQKKQRIDLNVDALYNAKQENLRAPFLNVQMMFEQRSSSLVPHQMMCDHNSSDLAPQTTKSVVKYGSSGLVPQGQMASDYDT